MKRKEHIQLIVSINNEQKSKNKEIIPFKHFLMYIFYNKLVLKMNKRNWHKNNKAFPNLKLVQV